MGTRLSAVALAALVVAGCGGGGDATTRSPEPTLASEAQEAIDELDASARPPDDAADIRWMLAERARALEAEDVLALSATSIGPQQLRDRRSARRAKRLDVERIRFVADELQTSGSRGTIAVTMSYRVRGMRRPFHTPRRVVVRKRSVGWRVTSDRARREPLPWEVAAFTAHRSRRIVLLAPRGMDTGGLHSGLERAYRDIRRDLPSRDLPPSVLVIAAAGGRQAERLTGGRIAKGVIALANVAVEWGQPPALPVRRVLGQRLIVITDRWRGGDEAARQSTLVHELTHTALDPDTSARTPPWLIEGVAMYVSNDDRRAEARARAAGLASSTTLRALCRPGSIFRLRGDAQGAAYAIASAAAEKIVELRGNRGLFRLYDAFNDSTIRGRTCAATTDRVLRRTLGISLARLEAAVAAG